MQNYHRYRPPWVIKNHEQKINSQGENHYKKRIEKQKFSSVLLRQCRRYTCGLLPPARANGTKREAIWYSELYLPFLGRYANYPKRHGLPQKDEVFLREEEPQRRIPSTAKAVDEKQSLRRRSELYLFRKSIEKESTEVMNYVVFSMPHGEI